MIKAVFFDIDGTLVSFRTHRVPDSTKEAIANLKAAGVKIFIATGRSGILMNEVGTLDTAVFDGLMTFNGQHCRVADKVVWSHTIPSEDVRAAVDFFDEHDISCMFEGAEFVVVNSHNPTAISMAEMLGMRLPPPTDLHLVDDRRTIQLIFFGNARQEELLLRVMPGCESTRWHPDFSDIIPRGGGKDVGMRKIIEYFGLSPEECMAFGDGENDISMLRYAGTGVAMGNAAESVRRAADYVTSSVDEDGIASALRHFWVI